MKAKWTPGPWRVGDREEKLNYIQRPIWSGEHMAVVCYVVGTTNPMLDWYAGACNYHNNAALIAAAPDLYDALDAIIRFAEKQGRDSGLYRAARAALAKARGEQP